MLTQINRAKEDQSADILCGKCLVTKNSVSLLL